MNTGGGVSELTVDVRDMLCAQALAVAARAVDRLAAGESVIVVFSAEDVQHDLALWARERGHRLDATPPGTLRLTRVGG